MLHNILFEGIVVWNWYETVESIKDGTYTKAYISKGVHEIQLNYYSDINDQAEETMVYNFLNLYQSLVCLVKATR